MSRHGRMRAGEGQRQLATEIKAGIKYHVGRIGDKAIIRSGTDTKFWEAYDALLVLYKRNSPGTGFLTQEQYDLVKDCL